MVDEELMKYSRESDNIPARPQGAHRKKQVSMWIWRFG